MFCINFINYDFFVLVHVIVSGRGVNPFPYFHFFLFFLGEGVFKVG